MGAARMKRLEDKITVHMQGKYFLTLFASVMMTFCFSQKTEWADSIHQTSWNGFDRYDFVMDSINFEIRPFHADTLEGTGIHKQVPGRFRCLIVVPKKIAPGSPWSWRGCYWDHQPQTEIELLRRGFHIAYIMSDPGKSWDAWYQFLTEKYKLSKKPAFIGMSRGGVNEYAWASMNPEKVSCIYADNPALYPESIQRLGELKLHDVPLLHICGSFDFLLEQHTLVVENIYRRMGGRISVMIKEGTAHHPHSLQNASIIAGWMEQSVQPAPADSPDLSVKKFDKSWYYSFGSLYRFLPEENDYAVCRGPLFFPCYERYDEESGSPWGLAGLTIIVPKKPTPGKQWVLRANQVGHEPSAFDLALLAKGYYIIAPPLLAQAGPLQKDWDSVYDRLVSEGFSRKITMEGIGAGAGEAYAWAIVHPDRVSVIFSVNPVLRSLQMDSNISDRLTMLESAGISLIDVSGSLDPWYTDYTVKIEQRYKKLGGNMKVIVHENGDHFYTDPQDPDRVVDFISKNTH
jgi:pimeloyl-ACP methyl ester carboxylesterase